MRDKEASHSETLPGRRSHHGHQHQPQILEQTKFLRLVQDAHWTYAQRLGTTGAMAIVAVTDDQELLLVDQYRIPVQGRVIELPAGLVGDLAETSTESIEEAARRELVEEVGFEAERIERLTSAVSSAGLTDEAVHLVRAIGLRQVSDGGGDETEDIVVHRVPLDSITGWLEQHQRQGWNVDYKVFAGLWYLRDQF